MGPSRFCSWAIAKEGSRKQNDNIKEIKSFILNIFLNKGVKNNEKDWISSCGGFTGDCWYPSEDNYEIVEFTNLLYKKNNGIIKTEINYSIIDSRINGNDILYIAELENGNILRFKFINSNLSIESRDFWKEYKRVTE